MQDIPICSGDKSGLLCSFEGVTQGQISFRTSITVGMRALGDQMPDGRGRRAKRWAWRLDQFDSRCDLLNFLGNNRRASLYHI